MGEVIMKHKSSTEEKVGVTSSINDSAKSVVIDGFVNGDPKLFG